MKTSEVEIKQGEPRSHSNSNDNNNNCYVCTLCNYASDKSANLTRHVRSMHEIIKDSLFCCGLKFQSKADYREHNKMSHREGHICTVCSKSFSRRALLKRHQSVHTGIKEFKCDHCPYSSSHKSNVVRHLKIHRDIIGEGGIEKTISKKRCHQHQPEPDSTTMTIPGVANFSLKKSHHIKEKYSSMGTRSRFRRNTPKLKNQSGKSDILLQMLSTKMEEDKETRKLRINHSIDSILGLSSTTERQMKIECLEPNSDAPELDQLVSSSTSSMEGSDNGDGSTNMKSNITSGGEKLEKEEEPDELVFADVEPELKPSLVPLPITDATFQIRQTSGSESEKSLMGSHNHSSSNNSMMEDFNYYAYPLRPPYLPTIDWSGFTGSNWGTPPFPHISPYAYYGISSGFGSVIGFEESRYLSSLRVPSLTRTEIPAPSGSLSSLHQTMTSALNQNQSNQSYIPNPNPNQMAMTMTARAGSSSAAAAFNNERDYNPAVFGAGLSPYFFAPSTPELSSNNIQSQSVCNPSPRPLQALPSEPLLPPPGVEYTQASRAGMRLSFTQVSNAQVTHFVSY